MSEPTMDATGVFDDEDTGTFTDKAGRAWVYEVDLPGRTLKTFFRDAEAWGKGTLSEEQFDRMYEAVWHILRRRQPNATLDEVIDALSIKDVQKLISELFGRLSDGQASVAAQQTPPAPTAETTRSPSTSARRRGGSKSASGAAR